MSELVFSDVTVRFGGRRRGTVAVDAVDLTVPEGTVVGLVGESGCGKSTLARAAVGLSPVTRGRVLLDGRPLRRPSRAHRPVQMVFQDPFSSLDPRMTVGAAIAECLPRGTADPRAAVHELLEQIDLPAERSGSYPGDLSGGQRQRVALARALATRPRVLIADEITSALDVSVQGTVLNLLLDLQRRLRLPTLFISHDFAVVRYVSDVVAVMYLGRIVEVGPAQDVLTDPQHPYTRELLAAAADPADRSGRRPGPDPARPAVADAEPADPRHPPSGCRFHPRCPVGPVVRPEREVCRTVEPDRASHEHGAACHFARPVPAPPRTDAGGAR